MGTAVAAGPPGTPHVDKITPNSATLSWTKPTDTGGGKIKGYIVEMKPKDGDWTEATPFPVNENEFTVPNLKEGQEYQFRVKAVNEAGPGTPSAGLLLIQLPHGTFYGAVIRLLPVHLSISCCVCCGALVLLWAVFTNEVQNYDQIEPCVY